MAESSREKTCAKCLRPRVRDVQQSLTPQTPTATFPGPLSLLRLDHIFVSRHFEVHEVEVAVTPTARMASEHRSVSVRLGLPSSK